MRNDNPQTSGRVSRLLHWLMVATMLLMSASAIASSIYPTLNVLRRLHQGFGITLLVLVALRIALAR
ncbi:Cytochrome b(N-terminal)/b6/petB [Kingella potus]|uniref:Cytochrome b(N-terminal)/b6/petB n=1 Tax=Kingella potus TaxID=265175 RepID=A0A377QYJ8_9NEIS|nr:hypothetical protein [Kingella potus]UOP01373.1 hypothetical protein LVJ84_03835 [Kingella potus]STR00313.1 Cytochrome b(N-terminal)/b6/petB [Kingella potus]